MNDSTIEKAVDILRENSFLKEAEHLESLVKKLHSSDPETRENAVVEIQGLCQVRSYGSLNIKTMNGWAWNSILEKIARKVRR